MNRMQGNQLIAKELKIQLLYAGRRYKLEISSSFQTQNFKTAPHEVAAWNRIVIVGRKLHKPN